VIVMRIYREFGFRTKFRTSAAIRGWWTVEYDHQRGVAPSIFKWIKRKPARQDRLPPFNFQIPWVRKEDTVITEQDMMREASAGNVIADPGPADDGGKAKRPGYGV
jgi:hypothetical protein